MFEGERTALIGMALQASLFIGGRLRDQGRPRRHAPGGRKRTVRIVAVRTSHEPGVDGVFEGHGEIRLHICVTAVAELRLSFRQQKLWCFGFVYRVALRASDAIFGVRRVANVCPGQGLGMAAQAGIENLLRRQFRERNDG